jgi:hypothetical protein
MARTRWPPGSGNPGLLPRPGRSDRQRRWVPLTWGPADRSFPRTARTASADSEVRPGPRPPTLRPHQGKTGEAGPEALPTSSLPNRCGSQLRRRRGRSRADWPVMGAHCLAETEVGSAIGHCAGDVQVPGVASRFPDHVQHNQCALAIPRSSPSLVPGGAGAHEQPGAGTSWPSG